ncbi:MAG TPA: LysM peptidoglycan-binding domain-containing protein [Rhabdochlamydiaceae bacterium]|nr:LysM peptidoglycan-binding domain-containing protein [Rhabdochlamydiaceae bacterium]
MMTGNSFETQWIRRTKWLTQALIISGTLNIGLLATFVSFILKEKNHPVSFELRPLSDKKRDPIPNITNEILIRSYSVFSFQDLLMNLDNKELVEDGYAKRDIALACLVSFHHFNLERALGGLVLQQRSVFFTNAEGDEKIDLAVFPGLADYQYQAIIHYAKTEKWPLTSKGLFYEIKEQKAPRDSSLLEAFYLTPEFHAAAALFSRSGVNIQKEVIVELLSQGDWKMLNDFTMQQRLAQDLSSDKRRSFLLEYLNDRSVIAAKLLFEQDVEFVSKRLDDLHIVLLLDLLLEKTPSVEMFAKELLTSPRSDIVWKAAACKLYSFVKEPVPEPYDHSLALKRFFPEAVKEAPEEAIPEPPQHVVKVEPVEKVQEPKPKSKRLHVVQPGESLWKISRKYRVSIEAIMKVNHLESERLRPGKQLEIPEKVN